MSGDYQAWIDVGGTFTDCYVVEDEKIQQRLRIKVLSSGLVPISLSATTERLAYSAAELGDDPPAFWNGVQLRCYDAERHFIQSITVIDFTQPGAKLLLAATLPASAQCFELDAGLEAPVLAVRRLIGCPLLEPLPRLRVRMGTTRGTNALLTRRGAKVALAITQSLEDLLLIGDQTRPHLFELAIRRDDALAAVTIPIVERLNAAGQVLLVLDESDTRRGLRAALDAGCESLAICLMHAYRNAEHELLIERWAREVGFRHISRSSNIAPLIEIVARARTTVVDAYLGPIVRSYLARLVDQFGGSSHVQLQVMTSAGGLVSWSDMAGKDSILSGPAGGVVALRALAEAAGMPRLIGLDMGGTSTDTARTAPDQGLEYESTKAGVRILTPTLPIETVASGGGSICWFDGVSLRVGPQSAGAMPGPACYGRGGPLTITDLNVYLGRVPADQFPFPLDLPAIALRLDELQNELKQVDKAFESRELLADGLRSIAAQQMAEAVRTVSIAQGSDPREHALAGFGGAAGQHICEIADLLGIDRILHTHEAGLLSALGMGLAAERRDAVLPIYQPLVEVDLEAVYAQSASRMIDLTEDWDATADDANSLAIQQQTSMQLRYVGTDVALTIPWSHTATVVELTQAFHAQHRSRYGYDRPARAVELVAVRLEANRQTTNELAVHWTCDAHAVDLTLPATHTMWHQGQPTPTALVGPTELRLGARFKGPAVVLSPGSTLAIEPGWQASAGSDGTLLLTRHSDPTFNVKRDAETSAEESSNAPKRDPIAEAVFAQRLGAIATQMGLVLQQTALSVNVKQRRDFSCAVFDRQGRMLASAPHVPVHLGAMGATVRAAIACYPDMAAGDVIVTNNPYAGGSHLPDVTVISGVFNDEANDGPMLFVANRAHHADIGGIAPGSMCVTATTLGEEGAIIPMLRMTAEQCSELTPLRELLASAPWPPRNIEENLADLRAQLAANVRGEQLLRELADSFSWSGVERLGNAVLAIADERVRLFLRSLGGEPRHFEDQMDDGTPICVRIEATADDRLSIDFTGTGATSPANFNANPSIVSAAIIYVLRCLIDDDLPLNEGMLVCVDLKIPRGILNPQSVEPLSQSPAVAAGNVETSQRVVDCLLGAFGVAAASQGTMNNLLFGNEHFGFYETICGGSGATSGYDGASGVHTHMTNTRLTDPEILEAKFPAMLEHFGLRRGSGGTGKWRGGDGVVRRIRFLENVSVSLLTSRRGALQPYGLFGGQAGAAGVNLHWSRDGVATELPAACFIDLAAGESIELQTPGGGGFGAEDD